MINDLPFILFELLCKMFADDTTLGNADKDLKTLVSRFVEKLKIPFKWCKFNRLNINWSKICFMFVTNKRFNLKLYQINYLSVKK